MPELYEPMSCVIGEYGLGTGSAAVAAVVQEEAGIGVLLFPEYFKRFLLQQVEVGGRNFFINDSLRRVGQRPNSAVAYQAEAVEGRQIGVVDIHPLQDFVEKVTAISVGETVLEYPEIAAERGWLGDEESGL